MKTDFTNLQANMAAHYTRLAQIPGWKQYARHRVEFMARESPELWGGLPQAVRSALESQSAQSGGSAT